MYCILTLPLYHHQQAHCGQFVRVSYHTANALLSLSPCPCDCTPLQAPLISIIQIAGNNLTGTFPRSWTILPWLSQLDLSYNNLSGTVPYELAFQSMLTSLRLHSNPQISGTISPWFRCAESLLQIAFCSFGPSLNLAWAWPGPRPGLAEGSLYQEQPVGCPQQLGGWVLWCAVNGCQSIQGSCSGPFTCRARPAPSLGLEVKGSVEQEQPVGCSQSWCGWVLLCAVDGCVTYPPYLQW